jgi:predicted flap endonuclease-1-like 5' DNA nuclease
MITDPKNWNKVSQAENQKKGKLITVEKFPGHFVKMYEADAMRLGLVKPRAAGNDKLRPAEGNKLHSAERSPETVAEMIQAEQAVDDPQPPQGNPAEALDDFATIPGLGPATARALQLNGIMTFEQLRRTPAKDLAFLQQRALMAIEKWRR